MALNLKLGIKRTVFRAHDGGAASADAEFQAVRDGALQAARYKCRFCGFESVAAASKTSLLHVHHMDNDHANNQPENLVPSCCLDHSLHHIGCDAPTKGGDAGWATQMRIAYAPELSAADFNLLQRAIGAALDDPDVGAAAVEMNALLGVLTFPVRDVLGSSKAKDFAAAFANMTDPQYNERKTDGLQVLFHPSIQRQAGAELLQENKRMRPGAWEGLLDGIGHAR